MFVLKIVHYFQQYEDDGKCLALQKFTRVVLAILKLDQWITVFVLKILNCLRLAYNDTDSDNDNDTLTMTHTYIFYIKATGPNQHYQTI